MAVDPSISLGVTGGNSGMATAGAVPAQNPLALAGTYADVQNKLNTNKAFQLELQAKQKLGQIMATSPDIPTAIQRAQQDPSVSAFVPDIVQTITGTENTLQQYKGQVQTQTKDAFEHAASMLPGLVVDPKGATAGIEAWVNSIPDPSIKATVSKNINHILEAVDDPGLNLEGRKKAITAAAVGIPGALEAMNKFWAQPVITDRGDVLQPGTVQGPIPTIGGRAPGSIQNAGNALSKGLPPGVYSPEGMVSGGKYGSGGPNGVGATTISPGVDSAVANKIGADGKPLIPPGVSMDSPPVDRSSFGVPVGPQAASIAEMQKKWAGAETEAYQNSGILLGQIGEMKHNLTQLESGKGMLAPGSGAEFRLGVAKLGKLVEDVTGADLGVNKEKIANAEDAMKLTQRLGISYLTSVLGSQREAAETIRNITEKGIPGIQNTYLGASLMMDMIESVAKRSMEEHEFRTVWQARSKNRGNLTGADIAFNQAHPATDYIKQGLEKYGLTESGFKDRAALDAALAKGLITAEQAEVIRKNKGKIPADLPKVESDSKT